MGWAQRSEQYLNPNWWHWSWRAKQLLAIVRGKRTRVATRMELPSPPAIDEPIAPVQRWTPARPALRSGAVAHLRSPDMPPDRQLFQAGAARHLRDRYPRDAIGQIGRDTP